MSAQAVTLRMVEVIKRTDKIVEIALESMAKLELPAWAPGAHIEVQLPSGLIRHYSLCGDVDERHTYRIAVLRDDAGRGGSAELHAIASPDTPMPVRPPKNNFAFEADASSYLFLAGGIGITPFLPMVQLAERSQVPWRLVYGGRSRSQMAYAEWLESEYPGHIAVFADDNEGRPDLEHELESAAPGTIVYACGPTPMLDLVSALVSAHDWPIELRLERFNVAAVDTVGQPFDVELARTGVTIAVAGNETILQAMQARKLSAPFSCENGYCGTCEAVVLDGTPEHRDTYLSDDEKADSFTMMICVSRCIGSSLVLDL